MRIAAISAVTLALAVCSLAAGVDERRVDQIFAAYDKPDSAGCALGLIRDGEFVYRKGYGAASLELGVPLTSRSVFYMGSVSKQFTAASVVLAAEKGLLSLDDNVRKYVPELPDYGHPITLRQMLHHTSGFRDVLALLALSGRNAEDLHPKAELLALVARQKSLNYTPGDEYLYSNTNYFLLAEIVARVSGKPFSAFAEENIFRPLGMTHTRFFDDHTAVVPGRVPAYAPRPGGGFRVDWSTNFDKVGDGGLMSSVDDLLLWDRNFHANKLGTGTLLKELQTRGVLNSGQQIDYALGLTISTYRERPVVAHGGALFGYRTEILRFPEQRFTVLCLCNLATANPAELSLRVADVVLEKELGTETSVERSRAPRTERPPLKDVALAPYEGAYRSAELDATIKLSIENGSLMLHMNWDAPRKLDPSARDEFRTAGGLSLAFRKNSGQIAGFDLSAGRVRNVRFEKID